MHIPGPQLPAGASLRWQPPGVGSATHVFGEGGVGMRVYTVYIYHRGTGTREVTDQRSRQPTAHPQVGNPLYFPSWGGLGWGFFCLRMVRPASAHQEIFPSLLRVK